MAIKTAKQYDLPAPVAIALQTGRPQLLVLTEQLPLEQQNEVLRLLGDLIDDKRILENRVKVLEDCIKNTNSRTEDIVIKQLQIIKKSGQEALHKSGVMAGERI